jgi:hypothetical protein
VQDYSSVNINGREVIRFTLDKNKLKDGESILINIPKKNKRESEKSLNNPIKDLNNEL